MLTANENIKIYLACGDTDMRKSINGLVSLVENSFQLDPFEQALFVFCNRQRNRLKILTWEDNGFWLHFKRLERGHFKWPNPGEDATMNLSLEELTHLIKRSRSRAKIASDRSYKKPLKYAAFTSFPKVFMV